MKHHLIFQLLQLATVEQAETEKNLKVVTDLRTTLRTQPIRSATSYNAQPFHSLSTEESFGKLDLLGPSVLHYVDSSPC